MLQYAPLGQEMHLEAITSVEYVPKAHEEQNVDAAVPENDPGVHS